MVKWYVGLAGVYFRIQEDLNKLSATKSLGVLRVSNFSKSNENEEQGK